MKHETLGEKGKINVANVKITLTYDKACVFLFYVRRFAVETRKSRNSWRNVAIISAYLRFSSLWG